MKALRICFLKNFFFLKKFNVVELINSKIQFFLNETIPLKYLIDLNFKNNSAFVLLRELSFEDNSRNKIILRLFYYVNYLQKITL